MMMRDEAKLIFWVLIIVAIVIAGPFLSIWALNTLFPVLVIPYTFDTWLAMLLIGGVFRGFGVSTK
jgi:uncharacterized membrane protein YedE/YeeE